jgi:hypothetical protein
MTDLYQKVEPCSVLVLASQQVPQPMSLMGHSRRIGTLTTLAACPLCLQ